MAQGMGRKLCVSPQQGASPPARRVAYRSAADAAAAVLRPPGGELPAWPHAARADEEEVARKCRTSSPPAPDHQSGADSGAGRTAECLLLSSSAAKTVAQDPGARPIP